MFYTYISIAAANEGAIGREFIEVILKFLVILYVFIIVIIPFDNEMRYNWLSESTSGFQKNFQWQLLRYRQNSVLLVIMKFQERGTWE